MRRAAALLVLAPLALSACESTQDKSARLKREGRGLLGREKGLTVGASNRDVRVVDSAVLHDRYGAAAVVVFENTSRRDMADVPVAIDVRGAGG
ncbi:MAG TPA: hypothetical protein VGJ70_01670, partial [Solirubrobacteraceae bacterium]